MIYLAQPYSHQSKTVRLARFKIAEYICALEMGNGEVIYSPIVHCHKLTETYNLPGDFDFWQHHCIGMLERATGVLVLELPGWRESKGLQSEMEFWKNNGSKDAEHFPWNEIQQNCTEYRDVYNDRPMLYWVNILNEAAKV